MLKVNRNSPSASMFALLMSCLLVISTLLSFVAGGDKAYAGPPAYTPITGTAPDYSGPLTWVDYTPPLDLMSLMLSGAAPEFVYLPISLDIDEDDTMYVAKLGMALSGGATDNGIVVKITDNGQTETVLPTSVEGGSDLKVALGIDVDQQGNLYVAENSQLSVSGNGTGEDNAAPVNEARILMLPDGASTWKDITYGEDLNYATGVTVDRNGNVYAVDSTLEFDSNDDTVHNPAPRILKLADEGTSWDDITGTGVTFDQPFGIVVDGAGNVFVSDVGDFEDNDESPNMGEVYKLPAYSTIWESVTPSTPFVTLGLGIDRFDNVLAMNMAEANEEKGATIMKLEYNEHNNNSDNEYEWDTIDALPEPMPNPFNFDIAADGSGYMYKTNLFGGNVSKLMAALVYDGNIENGPSSGSVPAAPVGYEPNTTATVTGNTGNLVNPGFFFNGWNTKKDGSGTSYVSGDTINMTQTVTLYAVWSLIPPIPPIPPVPPVPPITLNGISLDDDTYSLTIDDTHQTVVEAVYSDNSRLPLSSGVTFTSSMPAVATVNSTGLVTALGSGETVISAVYQGYQDQATVTVVAPVSNPSDGGSSGAPDPDPAPAEPETEFDPEVIVDGEKQDQLATAKKDIVDGRTVITVTLDSSKVLDKMKRDNNKLLTIPLTGDNQVVIGQLNAGLVKAMESNEAEIQIVTDRATYTLPASQINVDSISAQIGTGVALEDITVQIEISEASEEKTSEVQAAAERNQFEVVAHPVDFEISASYGSQTVQANKFNSYVERRIALPEGVDPEKLTTGVVLTADGELFHVPTVVVEQDGNYYAVIKSLTNSTYSVIYNPMEMEDVKGHWASADVNDMSSRLIIQGVTATEFRPEASITRAEFTAIITRALGIQDAAYTGNFTDVGASDWYAGAVQAADDYNLIDGYEDGTFRPTQSISREEATVVLSRAAGIAGLTSELSDEEVTRLLSVFTDGSDAASWARDSVASAINLNLMKGKGLTLDLNANLTRAEAAAVVRRFLQAGTLINS